MQTIKAITGLLFKLLLWAAAVFAGYLLQMCVMPYVNIAGVTPSLLFAFMGVMTVCYGRLRSFWTGGIYGILMETMMPSITMLNLVFYPIAGALAAVPFADKNEKQQETDRSMNRDARNGNVYVRSVLGAGLISLLNEIINITYIYLGGTTLEALHFRRGLIAIVSTMVLTLLIAWPLRHLLGFKHAPREEKTTRGRYIL
ncbi:MAG: hypothetical protein IKK21_01615 [Clostridia bacterium]|nr:hypothetical protein [Clostridia bacterium]